MQTDKFFEHADSRLAEIVSAIDAVIATFPRQPELLQLKRWVSRIKADEARLEDIRTDSSRGKHIFLITAGNVSLIWGYFFIGALINGTNLRIRKSKRANWLQYEGMLASALSACDPLERVKFVEYEHEQSITETQVEWADLVVVFGSNQTIENMATICSARRRKVIGFGERLSGVYVDPCTKDFDLIAFVRSFLSVGGVWQAACNSPKVMIFPKDYRPIDLTRFVNRVERAIEKVRGAEISLSREDTLAACYNRSVGTTLLAGSGLSMLSKDSNSSLNLWCGSVEKFLELLSINPLYDNYFAVIENEQFNAKLRKYDIKFQTLGFSSPQSVSHSSVQALRYCQVSEMLEFDLVWEGIDIFGAFDS